MRTWSFQPRRLELPQRYAAPAKPEGRPQPMAPLGALARRVEASRASFARAGALGWIDAGVAVRSYVQAHHVRAEDTAELGATESLALWAAPTRIDDDGRRALRVICRAERGGAGDGGPHGRRRGDGHRVGAGEGGHRGRRRVGPKSIAACAAWLRVRGLAGDGGLDGRTLAALQGLWA